MSLFFREYNLMLNKELCKKCWNSFFIKWTTDDERDWKEGTVCCPYKYTGKGEPLWISITDEPPINCPFLLEQILNNQEKIKYNA